MIKVKETEAVLKSYIEFDDYIPINIEFGKWNISIEPTIYWRTGDFNNTLIEVGVGSEKGILRSITLILAKHINIIEHNDELNPNNLMEGIPIIKIEGGLKNTYTDQKGKLDLLLYNNKIKIVFSNTDVKSCIKSDRVCFGIDENDFISYIEIVDISEYERNKLLEFFKQF